MTDWTSLGESEFSWQLGSLCFPALESKIHLSQQERSRIVLALCCRVDQNKTKQTQTKKPRNKSKTTM